MRNYLLAKPLFTLPALLALAFVGHLVVLVLMEVGEGWTYLLPTYLFNLIAALIILRVLLHFAQKKNPNLGFFFMGGSLLKLLAFLFLFHPAYKADGEVTTLEFTSFFVPYFICLVFKSLVLFRTLNAE